MQLPMPMFELERHAERFEDEQQRADFEAFDLSDPRQNFKACWMCHEENMVGLAEYRDKGFDQRAPGFVSAMHGKCMTCHRLEERDPADPFSLGNCVGCHRWTPRAEGEELNMLSEDEEPLLPRVIEGSVRIPKK